MIHPLRELLGTGIDEALTQWAEAAPSDEDREAFLALRDAGGRHIFRRAERQVRHNPEAMAALAADPVPNKPHPFIYWITHGGGQWLYAIAQIIAAMLGLRLPPLPPIPPPPTPA